MEEKELIRRKFKYLDKRINKIFRFFTNDLRTKSRR